MGLLTNMEKTEGYIVKQWKEEKVVDKQYYKNKSNAKDFVLRHWQQSFTISNGNPQEVSSDSSTPNTIYEN